MEKKLLEQFFTLSVHGILLKDAEFNVADNASTDKFYVPFIKQQYPDIKIQFKRPTNGGCCKGHIMMALKLVRLTPVFVC